MSLIKRTLDASQAERSGAWVLVHAWLHKPYGGFGARECPICREEGWKMKTPKKMPKYSQEHPENPVGTRADVPVDGMEEAIAEYAALKWQADEIDAKLKVLRERLLGIGIVDTVRGRIAGGEVPAHGASLILGAGVSVTFSERFEPDNTALADVVREKGLTDHVGSMVLKWNRASVERLMLSDKDVAGAFKSAIKITPVIRTKSGGRGSDE